MKELIDGAKAKHTKHFTGEYGERLIAGFKNLKNKDNIGLPSRISFPEGRPWAGVYFLFDNEELVYVGQSTNVFARIDSHRGASNFNNNFDSYGIHFLDDIKERLILEAQVMIAFRPRYNSVAANIFSSPQWLKDYLTAPQENKGII